MDEILKRYESELELPAQKGLRIFLCPIGLVGAGKTTVVKPLAERLGLVRISSDEIRKIMREQGTVGLKAFDLATVLIRKYAEAGYGVAIDSDCSNVEKIERVEEAADRLDYKVIWIHINPPEEFILNKLRNFKHTWLFKNADEAIANYYRRKPLHENLSQDFTYTFDTSREDLPMQIDEAEKIIRNICQ
jgi:predicted kinase